MGPEPPAASTLDRRRFLGAAPFVALAAGSRIAHARPWTPLAQPRAWGVQLYTVRGLMAEDPERTLEAIAGTGYREVELAGLYGMTPGEMRRRLDAVGLIATSSHQSLADVRSDWERTLAGAVELGQSLVVVPSLPGETRTSEGLRRVADDFNRAGEAARTSGLRFGYHNHDWEYRPLDDGTVPMALLLERTDPGLVDWQMDVFWTVTGGGNPGAEIQESGRVTSLHLKDRTSDGRMVSVGDGAIDFDAILTLAARHGLLHAYVEHDSPAEPLESVRRSYDHLTRERTA